MKKNQHWRFFLVNQIKWNFIRPMSQRQKRKKKKEEKKRKKSNVKAWKKENKKCDRESIVVNFVVGKFRERTRKKSNKGESNERSPLPRNNFRRA